MHTICTSCNTYIQSPTLKFEVLINLGEHIESKHVERLQQKHMHVTTNIFRLDILQKLSTVRVIQITHNSLRGESGPALRYGLLKGGEGSSVPYLHSLYIHQFFFNPISLQKYIGVLLLVSAARQYGSFVLFVNTGQQTQNTIMNILSSHGL